jgi:hypothetical protein
MEMPVRSMEMAETAMETNGDGSRGTSPSRQGAGIETSVPQNLSLTAAALQNCSGKNADWFRVFRPKAFYRRKGIVRGGPGWSHHQGARPVGGRATLWCACPLAPPLTLFRSSSGKNRSFGGRFVQFRAYFLCSFSETQKQQKIGNWHYGILLVG